MHKCIIIVQLTLNDLTSDLYILLASHEHQDIARWKREVDLKNLFHRAVYIVFARRFGMEGLDRKRPTGNGKTWCIPVECRKLPPSSEFLPDKIRRARTLSAFIVADVTISFKSRRRDRTE